MLISARNSVLFLERSSVASYLLPEAQEIQSSLELFEELAIQINSAADEEYEILYDQICVLAEDIQISETTISNWIEEIYHLHCL